MDVFTHTPTPLLAHSIVCLEHQNTCLYGEVIQVVEARQIGWVRPLLLRVAVSQPDQIELPQEQIYPLQSGADLLWPICLFRMALDTEVMPLLSQLHNHQPPNQAATTASRYQLKQFVHQVWEAYPQAFEP